MRKHRTYFVIRTINFDSIIVKLSQEITRRNCYFSSRQGGERSRLKESRMKII